MKFLHSGYLGDVIYSLPVIREKGGGDLFLAHDAAFDFLPMGKRAEALTELLLAQPYITGVYFELPTGDFCNLNSFRYQPELLTYNIACNHARANGLPPEITDAAWLNVPAVIEDYFEAPEGRISSQSEAGKEQFPIIVNRSKHHQSCDEMYEGIVKHRRADITFVGLEPEYKAFCSRFGLVKYLPTPTLLDAAIAINGCDLFVGNQSCPAAIAEGLKKEMILEISPVAPNCCVNRAGRIDVASCLIESNAFNHFFVKASKMSFSGFAGDV